MNIQKSSSRSKAKVVNVGISLSVVLYSAHAFAGIADVYNGRFSSEVENEVLMSTTKADYSGSDLNGDGAVNAADFILLRNQLDDIPGDLDHDQAVTSADANILKANLDKYDIDSDLNRDGVVNATDIQLLGGRIDAKGLGDLNHDGFVSSADSEILRTKLHTADAGADINKDGVVNGADLILLFNRLDNKPGDLNHDGSVTYADIKLLRSNLHKFDVSSDLNRDGVVNAADFQLLRNRLNGNGDLNHDGFVSKADVEILKSDLRAVEQLNKDFNEYYVVESSDLKAFMAQLDANDKGNLDYDKLTALEKGLAIDSHLQIVGLGSNQRGGSGMNGMDNTGFAMSELKSNGKESAASMSESGQQTSATGSDVSGKGNAAMSANSMSLHSDVTRGSGKARQNINNLGLLADNALAGNLNANVLQNLGSAVGNLNADVLQNLSSTEIKALLTGLGVGTGGTLSEDARNILSLLNNGTADALQNLSLSEIKALLASQSGNGHDVSADTMNRLLNLNSDLLAAIADLGLDLNGDGVIDATDLLFLQDQLANNPALVAELIDVVTAQNLDGGAFQAENLFSNLPNSNGSGSGDQTGNSSGETPEPGSLWLILLAGLLMMSSLHKRQGLSASKVLPHTGQGMFIK